VSVKGEVRETLSERFSQRPWGRERTWREVKSLVKVLPDKSEDGGKSNRALALQYQLIPFEEDHVKYIFDARPSGKKGKPFVLPVLATEMWKDMKVEVHGIVVEHVSDTTNKYTRVGYFWVTVEQAHKLGGVLDESSSVLLA
jgi:hypothetical protein